MKGVNVLKVDKIIKGYKGLPVQAKASFCFLICAFLQKGISVISTPIFTRILTTAQYGQYNVFTSWMDIVSIFVSLRISYGVYGQGLVKFETDRYRFVSSMQGLSFFLTLVWTLIYIVSEDFWNNLFGLTTVQMFFMLILIWLTNVFDFWSSEQRVQYKYKLLVAITIAVSLANPILGVILVTHAEDRVTARIMGMLIVQLIAYCWMFFAQIIRGQTLFSKEYWLYAIRFNIPLIPHYLSQTVLNSSDRIMITNLVSDDAAGIYSLAYSLSLVMALFNTALMQTISPWIYQKIKARRTQDIASVAYICLAIICFVNLLLMAFAPEALAIFAPDTYYDAIYIIPPVAMSVFFTFCYDLFAKFEFYFEKTHYIMLASIFGAVLNIILNYIFINIFGYFAAGYTTLFCYIIYAIMHYMFMKKVCRENLENAKIYEGKIIFGMAIVFCLVGILFLISYRNIILRAMLIVIVFVVIFVKRKYIQKKVMAIMSIRKEEEKNEE